MLRNVPPTAEILRTEIFGPVAPVTTWTTEDELATLVNESEFGLASYVYSADLGWALRIAERLDIGMVGINRGLVSDPAAPFGGTKQSGLGRDGAREGIRTFQETQYISVDWASEPTKQGEPFSGSWLTVSPRPSGRAPTRRLVAH